MGRGSAGFGLDNRSKRFLAATRRREFHLTIVACCLVAGAYCGTGASAAAQERVYFAEGRSLTVVDAQSHAVLNTIPLADTARELVVTADGARAYVLFENGLATVDLRTAVTLDVIPINEGDDDAIYDLASSASGDRICLVKSIDEEKTFVWIIDPAQRAFLSGIQLAAGTPHSGVEGLAMSSDGSRTYALLDDEDDNSRSLVEIDAQSGIVTRSAPLDAGWGSGLAIVGDRVAYVGGASSVSVVDLATMSVSGSIPLGANGVEGVRAGPSEQSLFAWSERNLFVLEPQRLQVQQTLTLDNSISDLAVRSDGNEVYAALFASAPAEIVSLPPSAPITVTSAAVRGESVAVAPAPDGGPPLPTPRPSPSPGPTSSYRAFVASSVAATLSEIDTGSPAVTRVTGTMAINDLVASTDGSAVYGFTADGVVVLDPDSGQVIDRIGSLDGWHLGGPGAVSADGNTFWAATWPSLSSFDRRTGAIRQVAEPFGPVTGIALSSDGRVLYATVEDDLDDSGALLVVDPSTLVVLRAVGIYGGAFGVAVSPNGDRVYVGTGNHMVAVVDAVAGGVVAMIASSSSASAIALSPDGAFAYVTGDSTLSVIDTGAVREVASVNLGEGARGGLLAVTPDGQRALVTTNDVGQVAVVNLSSLSVVSILPVGEAPSGLAILPDAWTQPATPTPRTHRSAGPRRPCLFAAHDAGNGAADGTISLVDPIRRGVAASIRVGQWSVDPRPDDGSFGYDAVSSIAVDPDGTRLYATTQPYAGGAGSLVAIDPASRTVLDQLYVGTWPGALAVAPDGSRAYVLNGSSSDWPSLSVVDLVNWHLLAKIPVPGGPGRLVLSPDGRRLYTGGDVIDTDTNHVVGEIPTGALSPDGSRMYADTLQNGFNVLEIVDLATQTVVGGIDNAGLYSDLVVSPDGHTLLETFYRGAGSVAAIIDLDARIVRTFLNAGAFAESPVFAPSGDTAYVASHDGGIFEIDVVRGRIDHGIATAGNVTGLIAAMVDAPCEVSSAVDASPTIPPTSTPVPATPTSSLPPTPTPVVWNCAQYPNGCVDIEVGTASGAPGSTVQIDVRLSAPGWSVAGVQNDIVFGPSLSIADAQEIPCRVNPDIEKGSTAFGVLPTECAAGECTRLRALVLAVDNVVPIRDGSRLYTCDVTIGANAAPGTYSLSISNVGASDPTGQSLPVTSADGAVRVTVSDSPALPVARDISTETGAGCAISPGSSPEDRYAVGAIAILLAAARLSVRRRSDGHSRTRIGLQ